MEENARALRDAAVDGESTPRESLWQMLNRAMQAAVVPVGVVLAAGLWLLYAALVDVQAFQQDGKTRTFQSRAVTCDLQKAHGIPESPGCDVPEVVEWRSPDLKHGEEAATKEARMARELLCVIVVQQNRSADPADRLAIPPSLCPE